MEVELYPERIIKAIEFKSPLNLEDFTRTYRERRKKEGHPRDIAEVFTDPLRYLETIKELIAADLERQNPIRPFVHNTCADRYNTLCIHTSKGRVGYTAALYGWKQLI
ncbi:hypothetical protein COV20_01810 [Candidatus Woesearchaeota archaeon CG10_big_fil_rev_8_21_14_0_10_45_16]|nr:MAG: hypothetical protein COV20_01810 [Candidatus Woesearchaeota archaeon CG10_big_fil_rev_8_21_14_0_10_45_16]